MVDLNKLFYAQYDEYQKITDKFIFEKYMNTFFNKLIFYAPLFLVTLSSIINTLSFNLYLFYGNMIVFFFIIALYYFKLEKDMHEKFKKTNSNYSKDIAQKYPKFNRKYLRLLHFYNNSSKKLTIAELNGLIEIAESKISVKNNDFFNSLTFMIIISVLLGQLANTFGDYKNIAGKLNYFYFFSTVLYTRYVLFGTYQTESYKLIEFKEFLVSSKYFGNQST